MSVLLYQPRVHESCQMTTLMVGLSIQANVPKDDDQRVESVRLRQASLETRLKIIQSQFALASTLCKTADTELRYGHMDEAQHLTDKIRNFCESLRQRLAEPHHHMPEYSQDGFQQQLKRLEDQIQQIESRLTH